MMKAGFNLLFLGVCACVARCGAKLPGMLYPRDSETRALRRLDGFWDFRVDMSPSRDQGFKQKWYAEPLHKTGSVISMPVPASYNDIPTDRELRDFVGWAWYDKEFYVNRGWTQRRIVLRVDSAQYNTIVWVNGQEVMRHEGGHLPFESEISKYLNLKLINRVTIAVNNTLTPTTLPPGTIQYKNNPHMYPPGYFVQNLQMDFFNYAGLNRHVTLYTTSLSGKYIEDIDIETVIQGTNGIVNYRVHYGSTAGIRVKLQVLSQSGLTVAYSEGANGTIKISHAKFWWPYTMDTETPGYLYTMKVSLITGNQVIDVYRQPFGVRTVRVTDKQILINDKPFYCLGVGRHEDADFRGRGLDYAVIARDFAMMKWLGVNCFRTAVYPYAEEIMDQADQQGFVVIDESPAVGLIKQDNFGPVTLAHHKVVLSELYQRDKNRPGVILWAVANEPASNLPASVPYFKTILQHMRSLDSTRLVSFETNLFTGQDRVVPFVDVLMVNRYFSWYSDIGHTELIQQQLTTDLQSMYKAYKKPVMVSEYGADTVAGLHRDPSVTFTEEYQTDFLSQYHKVYDKFMNDFLVGEMVWNFADFITQQETSKVVGNRKGLLTRQRQPKMSAHLVRRRYKNLAATFRQRRSSQLKCYFVPPFC